MPQLPLAVPSDTTGTCGRSRVGRLLVVRGTLATVRVRPSSSGACADAPRPLRWRPSRRTSSAAWPRGSTAGIARRSLSPHSPYGFDPTAAPHRQANSTSGQPNDDDIPGRTRRRSRATKVSNRQPAPVDRMGGRRPSRRSGERALLRGRGQLGTSCGRAGWAGRPRPRACPQHRGACPGSGAPHCCPGGRRLLLRARPAGGGRPGGRRRSGRTVQEHLRAGFSGRAARRRRGPSDELSRRRSRSRPLDSEVGRLTEWLTTTSPPGDHAAGQRHRPGRHRLRQLVRRTVLVLATPLLPVNLKVIGLGTAPPCTPNSPRPRTLSTRLLDQLRGLPTLVGLGRRRGGGTRPERRPGTRRRAPRKYCGSPSFRPPGSSSSSPWPSPSSRRTADWPYSATSTCRWSRSTMSLGTALFVLVLTPAYFAPARELARGYHARAEAAAAAELLSEIVDQLRSRGRRSPDRRTRLPDVRRRPAPARGASWKPSGFGTRAGRAPPWTTSP